METAGVGDWGSRDDGDARTEMVGAHVGGAPHA